MVEVNNKTIYFKY